MAGLFAAPDLRGLLPDSHITDAQAITLEQVVWGWLRPALGVEERPATIAPELFSAALELGAIAKENPAGLSSYQLGPERIGFSAERRGEILAAVASWGAASAAGHPTWSFPPALEWPDPAMRC